MHDKSFTRDERGEIDRRNLLKLAGGAAGGSLAVTAVGSARRRRRGGSGGSGGGKSGGRGQTSSTVVLDEPFTVSFKKEITTNASCNSDRSAQQRYNRYDFEYCDDGLGGGTICVIPDDSDVNERRVYEFRSKQKCKASSSRFQNRFSFGPSNSVHDCQPSE